MTVEPRLTCTDFLDVNRDLATGKFWPFRKQNSELLYINTKSNHPPNVIKQIPAAITHRIASLSCNNEEYIRALPAYKDALASSGHQLPDQPPTPTTRNRRQRRRKVIWFNPPYNQNVTTNVASKFLQLISRHFPRGSRYYKLFNRSTVKVSYSCMKSMGAIIASHNTKMLALTTTGDTPTDTCNCSRNTICPLSGRCQAACIIYKATVTAPSRPDMIYYGSTESPFKLR